MKNENVNNEDGIFFGHKRVSYDIKTSLVDELFSNVYQKYDLMNDLMSVGIHRVWKDIFCLMLDNPKSSLLDMAGGTGDISKRFYKFSNSQNFQPKKLQSQESFECDEFPKITMCDLNIDMLRLGKEKLINQGILGVNYVLSSAENLPFNDSSFDYYSVAFGIRNFTDIPKSLLEAKRVLRKGGKFLCLEFSRPKNKIVSNAYKIYSQFVIPKIGSAFGDRDAYQYLVESIELFPSQDVFADIIREAGFENVSYRNLSDGIVAIHTGYKSDN